VLFFSSGGKAYREKVWRLPEAGPQAKGRALINLLPELGTDTITTVLPLPQDESLWENLHLVFATAAGNVRRNKLSDFRNMRASGLIAMKLDEGDHLIGVATCRDGDDMMLASERGRCIRFHIHGDNLRVFAGRDSAGVRGIRLAAGDRVIGLSVLRHLEASPGQRTAYLKRNRSGDDEAVAEVEAEAEAEGSLAEEALSEEKFRAMQEAEQMILTVTDGGYGKRSSAFDYRVTGRGGQGITNITLSRRNGTTVISTFPVHAGDDLMLVTSAARLIRVPADQVRVTGRQAQGVTLVRLGEGETVTSVFPVMEGPVDADTPLIESGMEHIDPGQIDPGTDISDEQAPEGDDPAV
jgi:DNA gyrase subunit A